MELEQRSALEQRCTKHCGNNSWNILLSYSTATVTVPHEKINQCVAYINQNLTKKIWILTNIYQLLTDTEKSISKSIGYIG